MKTVVYGIIIGLLSVFLWGKTFLVENSTIVIFGIITGLILSLLVNLFGKTAKAGGSLVDGEINFVNSSFLTIIGGFLIVTGSIALLIRYIFF